MTNPGHHVVAVLRCDVMLGGGGNSGDHGIRVAVSRRTPPYGKIEDRSAALARRAAQRGYGRNRRAHEQARCVWGGFWLGLCLGGGGFLLGFFFFFGVFFFLFVDFFFVFSFPSIKLPDVDPRNFSSGLFGG